MSLGGGPRLPLLVRVLVLWFTVHHFVLCFLTFLQIFLDVIPVDILYFLHVCEVHFFSISWLWQM